MVGNANMNQPDNKICVSIFMPTPCFLYFHTWCLDLPPLTSNSSQHWQCSLRAMKEKVFNIINCDYSEKKNITVEKILVVSSVLKTSLISHLDLSSSYPLNLLCTKVSYIYYISVKLFSGNHLLAMWKYEGTEHTLHLASSEFLCYLWKQLMTHLVRNAASNFLHISLSCILHEQSWKPCLDVFFLFFFVILRTILMNIYISQKTKWIHSIIHIPLWHSDGCRASIGLG
jgi:hypothetical protein